MAEFIVVPTGWTYPVAGGAPVTPTYIARFRGMDGVLHFVDLENTTSNDVEFGQASFFEGGLISQYILAISRRSDGNALIPVPVPGQVSQSWAVDMPNPNRDGPARTGQSIIGWWVNDPLSNTGWSFVRWQEGPWDVMPDGHAFVEGGVQAQSLDPGLALVVSVFEAVLGSRQYLLLVMARTDPEGAIIGIPVPNAVGQFPAPPNPPPPPPPPNPLGPSGEQDEVGACCTAIVSELAALTAAVTALAAEPGAPGATQKPADLAPVVAEIGQVVAELAKIATAIANQQNTTAPEPPGIDFGPVVASILDLTKVISGFGPLAESLVQCVCEAAAALARGAGTPGAVDLSHLNRFADLASADQGISAAFAQLLVEQKLIGGDIAQLMQGSPWWRELIEVLLPVIRAFLRVTAIVERKDKDLIHFLLSNVVGGAVGFASELIVENSDNLASIASDVTNVMGKINPAIRAVIEGPVSNAFDTAFVSLVARFRDSSPTDLSDFFPRFREAVQQAIGFGLASFATTAGLEWILPFDANTMNSIGPLLATLAGFDEAIKPVLESFFKSSYGRLAEHAANAQFRTDIPGEGILHDLRARGVITEELWRRTLAWHGVADVYEEPMLEAAHRPISPFIFIRLMETGLISEAETREAMTFTGIRPTDQDRIIRATKFLTLQPFRQRAMAAITQAYERGLYTDDQLSSFLADFELPDGAEHLVHLEAAARKLVQTTDIYEKEISEAYKFGLISDAEYQSALESAGVNDADISFRLGRDSVGRRGRAAEAEQREEARQARITQRGAVQLALRGFAAGTITVAGLTAALLAAGLPAGQVATAVGLAELRERGNQVKVYNLLLPRPDAQLLRERVSAIEEQVVKKLISPDAARSALAALGISEPYVRGLIARWAAQALKLALPT